jgi:hypothetical protein
VAKTVEWWNSAARMRLVAQALIALATAGGIVALLTWPALPAIVAVVTAATSILCAVFAAFRLSHLREIDRYR